MQAIKVPRAAVEIRFPMAPPLVYCARPAPDTAAALRAAGFMYMQCVGRWQYNACELADVIDALRKLTAAKTLPVRVSVLNPALLAALRRAGLGNLRIIVPVRLLPHLAPVSAGAEELLFELGELLAELEAMRPAFQVVGRYEPTWLRPRPGHWPQTAEEREELYNAARSLGYRVEPDGRIWVDGDNRECAHRLAVAVGRMLYLDSGAWDEDPDEPRIWVDVFGSPVITEDPED